MQEVMACHDLRASIRQRGLSLGFCAIGFAKAGPQPEATARLKTMIDEGRHAEMHYLETALETRKSPESQLPGVKSVVSVALSWPARPDGTAEGISGHALATDYHLLIRELLQELLEFVRAKSGLSVEGRICVDSSALPEKAWAEASGIGRTGKNTLLIVPGIGSRIFLGELLLDLELEPDHPLDFDPCGTCTACLEACPTGALIEAGTLDARRCIAALTIELKRNFTEEEAAMTEGWLFGCDHCIDACPHNSSSPIAIHPSLAPREELVRLAPQTALTLTRSAFQRLFAGTTLYRLGLKRLKRNAMAVVEKKGQQEERNFS